MPPRYEERTKERIRRGLQKYAVVLRDAAQRGINEEETSIIVRDMLADLLGYERFREINAQYKVKGRYADWAVHIDGDLKFLVEVKVLGARLREGDLLQVTTYARGKPALDWAVLTTSDVWQCHWVPAKSETEQFFEVRLLDPAQAEDEKVEWLYLLSREAVSRDLIKKRREEAECYRPARLARVLLSDEVLKAFRRALKREDPRRRVDVGDLRDALVHGVIRGGDVYAAVVQADAKQAAPKKTGHSEPREGEASRGSYNMFARLITEGRLVPGEEVYDPEGQTLLGLVRETYIERTDGQRAVNLRELVRSSSSKAAAVKREGRLVHLSKLRRARRQ